MTIRALGPVIVVVDEADAVFGTREADGDSGVSGRVFAAFAAHIGDSTLRGRELWVAMTSRPDLLSIDMKRQGRFGLCIPLFPAQGPDDVVELFTTVAQGQEDRARRADPGLHPREPRRAPADRQRRRIHPHPRQGTGRAGRARRRRAAGSSKRR